MDSVAPRVRFAPSPTGYLHVGGLRTALYNYLFARRQCGVYALRIEDTDQSRFVEGAVESLFRSLTTLGVRHDEGIFLKDESLDGVTRQSERYPDIVERGAYGPYIQSERLSLYRQYADELVASGKAYRCFCSSERLEEMRATQMAEKRAPKYDRHCRNLGAEKVASQMALGTPSVIRLAVPDDRNIIFEDSVRGEVKISTDAFDDQVLIKSDGFPTYHLANVVDDHLMEITDVIRGEEWLPSTPKHILLYEAFGWTAPRFAHLPLLLNPDKSKLSKRQGDVAVEDYLAKGYLKEALINFVAFLGWNPGHGETQEIFSLEELVAKFDLANVHKAGAVFDMQKLDWLNGEYIKRLAIDDLLERALPFFESKDFFQAWQSTHAGLSSDEQSAFMKRVLVIEQDRLAKLSDVGEQNPFFFSATLEYDRDLLRWKENTDAETHEALSQALELLEKQETSVWSDHAALEKLLLEAAGDKRGDFLWPLRVALSGVAKSPSPFDCAWVLGREASLKRLRRAIEKLSV
ncbi:MAG: glutamate--tRNA ligase [Candidatus Moranbacteria bacterium]|nr:glutamate--tRNA ligase [Candidatus Moranbacteria bacterium]MBP6034216.1 glutamate--tRNA ligase [Candidatus Moranbacteria bacterium]